MCRSVSTITLFLVNCAFGLFSCISLGLGIWLAVARGGVAGSLSSGTGDLRQLSVQVSASVLLLIALSFTCLAICLAGCVGALRESKRLLIAYCVGLIGLLALQVFLLALAAANGAKIDKELSQELTKIVQSKFVPYNQLGPHYKNGTDNETVRISHLINTLQVTLKCCGIQNYTDITGTNTSWTRANPMYQGAAMRVPASCCTLTDEGVGALAASTDWGNFSSYLNPRNSTCPNEMQHFHSDGCLPVIAQEITRFLPALIAVSLLYIAFYAICIAMACCLIRNSGTEHHQSL